MKNTRKMIEVAGSKIKSLIFLGGGKMAEAIIGRLIESKTLSPQKILVADISYERLSYLNKKYKVKTLDSNTLILGSKCPIIIAVKPQNMSDLLSEVSSYAGERLVISIAAGIKTNFIEKYLTSARVIRVMPNTAAFVGSAISAISKGATATDEDVNIAREILGSIGDVIEIEEDLQNAVTAISGSGPAYYFFLTELLVKAAISLGLNKDQASKLAVATAVGAGKLLKTGISPQNLRKNVTSPGGTTEAAIKSFEVDKLTDIVGNAVQKAYQRAEELSEK